MKTFAGGNVHLCFLVFCLVYCTTGSSVREPKRSRTPSYALTPSLRVGRRSEGTWDPTLTEMKRKVGKMMAFPRVGRGSSRDWMLSPEENYASKRSVLSKSRNFTSMWMGPRLGVQKRDDIRDEYVPWTYIILKGQGPMIRDADRDKDYTPRLGRESEESMEEDSPGDETLWAN